MIDIGIIEKDKNPFSCQPLVEAGLEFNESIRKFLPPLLGKDEEQSEIDSRCMMVQRFPSSQLDGDMHSGWVGNWKPQKNGLRK
jgi:hypothetical protein